MRANPLSNLVIPEAKDGVTGAANQGFFASLADNPLFSAGAGMAGSCRSVRVTQS